MVGFQINNRSSWYSPVSEVRKEGSYIYEDFIPADGIDVKVERSKIAYKDQRSVLGRVKDQRSSRIVQVYAVGPYYAHAEARKAPGLDGKVERDADGKEVGYRIHQEDGDEWNRGFMYHVSCIL